MNIFIPYGGREDWGQELRYALRSLEQFEDFELTLYYTSRPEWITNCEALQIEKMYPPKLLKHYGARKYEQWFDTMNKLQAFAENFTGEKFIYYYDDILLLREACPSDIIHYHQEQVVPGHHVRYERSRHGQTILSSIRKCDKAVLYNYETHTPRIYETGKLRDLFRRFPLEKEIIPYSIASLYFNYYDHVSEKITEDYKIGFYGKQDDPSIDEIVGKTWLNYSYSGLMWRKDGIEVLKEWIVNRFKNKSNYERKES
jgi:hypothetical protein